MKPVNSLYIHIPYCLSKCYYCDFFSIPCAAIPDSYIDALINELMFRKKQFFVKELKTVYIGGGTPSLLSCRQMEKLFSKITELFVLNADYEFTMEVNPDDVTKELLDFLSASIVTRISCGIQSLDDQVLKNMNRRAGKKENLNAISLLKSHWSKELSLDLISALPLESSSAFIKNLHYICNCSPEHISLYSLTIEPETELGKKINKGILNYDYDFADEMWLKGKEILEEHGYFQYEVSNFAKKGKECRHNLVYWNHEAYLGCGSGAAGTVYKDDGSALRWQNINNLCTYIAFWNEKKNTETCSFSGFENSLKLINQAEGDVLPQDVCFSEKIDLETSRFEFFMMGLRKIQGVSEKKYYDCFTEPFPQKARLLFEKWQNKNFCEVRRLEGDTFYRLNSKGLLFLNRFLEELEL